MELPPDWETSPMVVRLGRYYFDDTPLIGKIVDFNMWDRQNYDNPESDFETEILQYIKVTDF